MLLKGVSMKFKMSNVTTSQYSSITREMVLSRTTCPHMTKLDLNIVSQLKIHTNTIWSTHRTMITTTHFVT